MGSDPGFLVVGSHGRHALVEGQDGRRWHAHFRGRKAEAVVGDRVHFVPGQGGEGVIEAVQERRNLLFRQDELRTKRFAANLDGLLMMLATEPPFSEEQLTRTLIAAEQASLPVTLVLNKAELPAAATARSRLAPYRAMGVPVLELSLKHAKDQARAALGPLLRGKTTMLLGQSGMGKSTLVNLMVPDAQAQTGEISQALNAGRHTTTHTRWYWLDRAAGSVLIDTPGFQAFGLHHIAAGELARCMPDLVPHLGQCRFHNCTHRQEPGCAVRAAVGEGDGATISAARYRLYLLIHEELSATRW